MGTPYQKIYEAFLSQIESDEWEAWELLEAEEDWRQLLDASLPLFRFPKIDLETRDSSGFKREVGNREIQVLVGFMKAIWLERVVNSWENLKPLYSERDFSPATMLNELRLKSTRQWKLAQQRERTYYRAEEGEPFRYSKMAGSTTTAGTTRGRGGFNHDLEIVVRSAEEDRQQNEELRKEAEVERERSELERETLETARQKREHTRQEYESIRRSAEERRDSSERMRLKDEELRAKNEKTRRRAETQRQEEELNRDSYEFERQRGEEDRRAAESSRDTAESQRVESEAARNKAEEARKTFQANLQSFESERMQAEALREGAERDRVAGEIQRGKAEEARELSESKRSQKEDERVKGEEFRVDNENKRGLAEESRRETFKQLTEDLDVYKTPLATDTVAGKVKVDKMPTETGEITVPSVGKLSGKLESRSLGLCRHAGAVGEDSIAIGADTVSNNKFGIAIGAFAQAKDDQNVIAIGRASFASGFDASSFGRGAKAEGYKTLSLGAGATATSDSTTAIGTDAKSSATGSSAFGRRSEANNVYSTAIGFGAVSDEPSLGVLGVGSDAAGTKKWLVPGDFSVGGTKNFEIPHPNPAKTKTHILRHGAVETNSQGDNLYRYKVEAKKDGDTIVIDLPDYFIYLNKNVQIWASAVDHFGNAFGKYKPEDETLEITCEKTGVYNILVIGTRNDKHKSVQSWSDKGEVKLKGTSWTHEGDKTTQEEEGVKRESDLQMSEEYRTSSEETREQEE